ncbi:kinase-like domain-containing protein [Daldinia vernicosa]|uniref:kinase-like domain-containing protein n=1 Tax=Daldinia vernicosa TaxID=114800 RepID=UPI002008A26C|nr:kinase-like domain-containing protein [Daldinia vernicosa]KAI0846444.1 kinase-like domain-containing protein [Daldinia vernicosa]
MFAWDSARQDVDDLVEYFSRDERFDFQGFIAHGSYGSASRVRYRNPTTEVWKDFVVKRAFQSETAEEAMRKEREYLRRFRGALHIVQILEVENNPLNNPDIQGEWITMEWLSCGSLGDFIVKAKRKTDRLPNRLLWRFFLCLVRACIAMANPPNRSDGRVERERVAGELPEVGVSHSDLHNGNVVLGEPLEDFEHTITPILKVIDFGNAGEWAFIDFTGTTTHSNLWDIGKLMVSLITLDERPHIVNVGHGAVALPERGMILTTDAEQILPLDEPGAPYPLLDSELGRLVCWCLATEPEERPSLWDIGNQVGFAVASKLAAAYPDRPEEDNDYISQLWRRIVFEADS